VTSVPGLCRLAPLGISKFAHLSDGCLDLVLVEDDSRKEFVRFLKRLGNQKDQAPRFQLIRLKKFFHLDLKYVLCIILYYFFCFIRCCQSDQ